MLSITLVQLLIGLSVIVLQASSTNRIVGGEIVSIKDFPYMVSINIRGGLCGGALIRSDIVLSAAHCFYGRDRTNLTVIGGSSYMWGYLFSEGSKSNISYIEIPADYVPLTLANDIALLKLKTPMVGPSIGTVALPTSDPKYGVFMTATGWGSIKEGGSDSFELRRVHLLSLSRKKCWMNYRKYTMAGMFCAISTDKDACEGDSGGPLVFNGTIYGIVSKGTGCARQNQPGVYTNVFTYIHWIGAVLNMPHFRL